MTDVARTRAASSLPKYPDWSVKAHVALTTPALGISQSLGDSLRVSDIVDHFHEHGQLPVAEWVPAKKHSGAFSGSESTKAELKALAQADDGAQDKFDKEKGHLRIQGGDREGASGGHNVEAYVSASDSQDQGAFTAVRTTNPDTPDQQRVFEAAKVDSNSVTNLRISGIEKGDPIVVVSRTELTEQGRPGRQTMQFANSNDLHAWNLMV